MTHLSLSLSSAHLEDDNSNQTKSRATCFKSVLGSFDHIYALLYFKSTEELLCGYEILSQNVRKLQLSQRNTFGFPHQVY